MAGNDLKLAVICGANEYGIDYSARHNAVDGILHQFIVISDLERMVLERLQLLQRDPHDLLRDLPFRLGLGSGLFEHFLRFCIL